MATLTFERNTGATTGSPTWTAFGANNLVFSGSATDLTATINTTGWNDGTHLGSGTPGTDQCSSGPNSSHMNNNKYVDSTHIIINGAASAVLNDTNLAQGACTCRIHMNNGVAVQTQNSLFFCYNNSSDTVEATGIECFAFERGVSATSWTNINDASASIGGNNSGERLDVSEQASATDSYWYLALSARGESAGAKTAFAFKLVTEVF